MSKYQKLFQKVRNNPKDVNFNDFCTLIQRFGFHYEKQEGSHKFYRNNEYRIILNLQAYGDKAKAYQVKQFFTFIDEYNLTLEE